MVSSMRQISITIIGLLWISFAGAETQDTPSSAGSAKTGFVKEHAITGARKLIGVREDHFGTPNVVDGISVSWCISTAGPVVAAN